MPYARLADLAQLRDELKRHAGEDAVLALGRGRAKGGVDTGYLTTPLTPAEEEAWDREIERTEDAHFILLLRQCFPKLIVLDVDDPELPFARDLNNLARAHGAWNAPSRTKGNHILLRDDAAIRELNPGEKARKNLKPPKAANGRNAGDLLTSQATAYAPGKHRRLRGLCEMDDLYQLLTGNAVSPQVRFDNLKERIMDDIGKWTKGDRNNSMFRLCVTLSRRLKAIGMWDNRDDIYEFIHARYAHANPDDTSWDRARIKAQVERYDNGEVESELPQDKKGRLLCSVYQQIDIMHDQEIYINGAAGLGELREVHAWDSIERDWHTMTFGARTSIQGGGERRSFSDLIGDVVNSTSLDITGDAPDLIEKHQFTKAVWDEFRSKHSVQNISQVFDIPDPQSLVNHFNLGGGHVLRVDGSRQAWDNGTAVQFDHPNESRYRAARRLCAPAPNESGKFIERLHQVWVEDGVVDYLRMRWAELLLPPSMHSPDFLTFYGAGGNGKGMIHDVLALAFGDFATHADIAAIQRTQGEPSPRTLGARAKMVGTRIIIFNEGGDQPLDEPTLKTITAGEKIRVGGLYTNPYDARVHGKLCIMTNEPLRLRQVGAAIERRACQIGCNQTFDDGHGKRGDPRVAKELLAEAPGVVRMLMNDVSRLLEWRHANPGKMYPKPAAVVAQTREWLDGQDPVQSAFRRFFVASREQVPSMIQGCRKSDGTTSGLAGVAERIAAEAGRDRLSPAKEVKRFIKTLGVGSDNARNAFYPIVPTDEFFEWVSYMEGMSLDGRRDVFYGVFKRREAASAAYGDKLDAALHAADNPDADEHTALEKQRTQTTFTEDGEIPW